MTLDPIISIAGALALAVILASAALHKLQAPAWFERQLDAYQLLPTSLTTVTARALPVLEGALALGLLFQPSRVTSAVLAAGLLALYALAMITNLLRGRHDLDCGCAGPNSQQPLHPLLLIRNGLLIALAIPAGLPVAERTLGLFDGFVVLAAGAATLLIYAATDALLVNRPRLLALTGR
ncbi:MAG: hypothetical protein JKY36_00520 [Erythrobacter sp.]|jgi:methylamine utilization protein MauE|uniref:MauE/DoxX family redox-associated membrane protein n=1 Tax=Alloalcanivorax xenomutans TaxID=1094342 RepID=UPI0006D5BF9B|nr:MauE/DoxX family redox-associated membrane protein [Alloalcanivorax xenomutans]MBL4857685.1 hypothetical protein [Erythrobacter sp.]PHS70412.1 MAG: methylamine utilization protein MauE [Alcanivorax sp.]CUR45828.1 Methylamine utilization protein MauE [Alloalcanivorax xenomutans]